MRSSRTIAKQRGIALLMTLGILALLLIMAMSFAYTARTERLATAVNSDLIRSRLLVESGLHRAIAAVRSTFDRNDPAPGTKFYAPPSGGWAGRRYIASVGFAKSSLDGINNHITSALASTIRVDEDTSWDFTPNETLHDAVGWVPIKVDHGSGEPECIGLVAYLVIDETGKIDPSQVVGNIDITEFPVYTGATFTEDNGNPNIRVGLDLREIAMADVYNSSAPDLSTTGFADDFRFDMRGGRWFSMQHIMRGLSNSSIGRPDQVWLNAFVRSLRPFSLEEPEAYQETFDGPAYYRCPVNDIDWNTIDIGTFPIAKVDAASAYPGAAALGVPWVAQMTGTAPSTANQIKANLIDFLDDDVGGTAPTDTENDYATDASGHPIGTASYVGLEAVPFVNEVFVRVRYAGLSVAFPVVQINLQVEGALELVNPYDVDRTVHATISLPVQALLSNGKDLGVQFVTLSLPPVAVPANGYIVTPWSSLVKSYPEGSTLVVPADLPYASNISARITDSGATGRVRVAVAGAAGLPTPTNIWDLAELPPYSANILTNAIVNVPMEVSAEVNDPRCNLLATDWAWVAGPAVSSGAAPATGTPGSMNTRCVDPGDGDQDSPDPISWSTNFIRNGDVQSFWELGAIHRGEPWRTVNLHSYDLSAGVGTYKYGDWPLLNQVRLGNGDRTRGQINVWGIPTYVWKPLLQNITVGGSYLQPSTGGVRLNGNAELKTIAETLTTEAPAWSPTMPHGRAAIVAHPRISPKDKETSPGLIPGILRETDRLQEELPCKLVGLLNDRISYYTILVFAKAVQDIGEKPLDMPAAAPIPQDWIKYQDTPDKYCRVMAEQKAMALVWRDRVGNRFRIASFQYLEE